MFAASLVGCSSSPYRTYDDTAHHFSLQYPSDWSDPTISHAIADRVPSYVVSLAGKTAQARVVVNSSRPDFSNIANGQVAHQGPNTLFYYLRKISGRPGLLIVQKSGDLPIDHEYAYVNSARWGYDIEMVAANGISPADQKAFLHMLQTFKIGHGG